MEQSAQSYDGLLEKVEADTQVNSDATALKLLE
jgi:hypothetical protein